MRRYRLATVRIVGPETPMDPARRNGLQVVVPGDSLLAALRMQVVFEAQTWQKKVEREGCAARKYRGPVRAYRNEGQPWSVLVGNARGGPPRRRGVKTRCGGFSGENQGRAAVGRRNKSGTSRKEGCGGLPALFGFFRPNNEIVVRPNLLNSAEWRRRLMTPAEKAFRGFLQI